MIKTEGLDITEQDNWDGLWGGTCPECGCELYLKGRHFRCAGGCGYRKRVKKSKNFE